MFNREAFGAGHRLAGVALSRNICGLYRRDAHMSARERGRRLVASASTMLWLTLFLLAVGCAHHEDRALLARTASTEQGIAPLPAAFAGDLPCADCSGGQKRCQKPLSVPTHTRDSERGASDCRTGFAPVGPFVHLNSLPSFQKMVPDTFISSLTALRSPGGGVLPRGIAGGGISPRTPGLWPTVPWRARP